MKYCFKTLLLVSLFVATFTSCQDTDLAEQGTADKDVLAEQSLPNDMLVFSCRENLNQAIDLANLGCDSKALTRVSINSYNTTDFKSLLESNKEKFYASLTPEQIEEIENDEDDLEYCLSDSIIADYAFAQLLNEAREIQVGDTVYRYFGNGVAMAPSKYKAELRLIDQQVAAIRIDYLESQDEMQLLEHVTFLPMRYRQVSYNDIVVAGGGTTSKSTESSSTVDGLALRDGTYIPGSKIRQVDFESKGDGGWLHRLWNNIWGKNVLAITKFNGHRRMRLGFYDQNYIVYSNIGIEVKMQKKRWGIWFNCKASDIRLGWSAIELKYEMPKPIKTYFSPDEMPGSLNKDTEVPYIMRCNFPFKDVDDALFNIPLIDYDVTLKDVNKVLTNGLKLAVEKSPYIIKQLINQTPVTQKGIFAVDDKRLLTIVGPDETCKTNGRTLEKKFYASWGSFTFNFGFLLNGNISFKGVDIKKADKAELGRGVVYAAVNYGGEWRACRIIKNE